MEVGGVLHAFRRGDATKAMGAAAQGGGRRIRAMMKRSSGETLGPIRTGSMALVLRPNCEYYDRDLPPASTLAQICSYECTFCTDCVDNKLHNVCPNCGGGFAPRPIRPAKEWRPGISLEKQPPSSKRVRLSFTLEEIAAHAMRIKNIPPEQR